MHEYIRHRPLQAQLLLPHKYKKVLKAKVRFKDTKGGKKPAEMLIVTFIQ